MSCRLSGWRHLRERIIYAVSEVLEARIAKFGRPYNKSPADFRGLAQIKSRLSVELSAAFTTVRRVKRSVSTDLSM